MQHKNRHSEGLAQLQPWSPLILLLLKGEWGSEYAYRYRGRYYGNHIGIMKGIHSPTLP